MRKNNSIDSVYDALYNENLRHSSLYERNGSTLDNKRRVVDFSKQINESSYDGPKDGESSAVG